MRSQATWDLWWNLNRWEFLHRNEILKRHANVSRSADNDLGGVVGDVPPGGALSRDEVDVDVVPVLRHALHDSDARHREAAVIALGKTGSAVAIAPLRKALVDPNATVRQAAAVALGLLRQPQAVSYLVEMARDSTAGRALVGGSTVSSSMRRHAAFALGLSRDLSALTPLLDLIDNDDDRRLPVFAVAAVGILGQPGAVPHLCRIVSDRSRAAELRASACIALSKIGDRGPIVLRVLQAALDDRADAVVRAAATALGSVAKPTDATLLGALHEVARKHRDQPTRALALMALAQVGNEQMFGQVSAFLNQKGLLGGYAPLAVAYAGRSCGKVTEALSLLRRHARRSKDAEIRRACWVALGILGARSQVGSLMDVAKKARNPLERAAAAAGLGLLGDPRAAALLEGLTSPETHGALRGEAALALGLVAPRRAATERLVGVLQEAHDDFLRAHCAIGLGLLGSGEAIAPLRELATGPGVQGGTRAFASGALGLLAEPDDLPILYRHRANNLLYIDMPEMRRLMLLL